MEARDRNEKCDVCRPRRACPAMASAQVQRDPARGKVDPSATVSISAVWLSSRTLPTALRVIKDEVAKLI